MKINKCRSCSGNSFIDVLDFGSHPWCGDFLEKNQIGKEIFYPLKLIQCKNCELLQLDHTVTKEKMFSEHSYLSSTTITLKNFFTTLALENKKQFSLNKNDLILDIGGNDGTQMIAYRDIGLPNSINFESAKNIAKISNDLGINTINDFFNFENCKKNIQQNSCKLINASGVFFHLEELHSVIQGINYSLKDDGCLIIQFMYAGSMIESVTFDAVYHEHLCLYTLKSLTYLLELYDLYIFDSFLANIHSGSIIAKVGKKKYKNFKITKRHIDTINYDKRYDLESVQRFANSSIKKKENLLKLIKDIYIKDPQASVYGFGAPAKGNTLINYLGLDNTTIKKIVEINDLKVGLYTPGSHIEIIKESKLDLPSHYLLLSHNFKDEIIKKNRDLMNKTGLKFIIPFPEIEVID